MEGGRTGGLTGGRTGGRTGGMMGRTTGGTIGLIGGGIRAMVAAGAPKAGSTTMKPEAFADGAINKDVASVRTDLSVTRFI